MKSLIIFLVLLTIIGVPWVILELVGTWSLEKLVGLEEALKSEGTPKSRNRLLALRIGFFAVMLCLICFVAYFFSNL